MSYWKPYVIFIIQAHKRLNESPFWREFHPWSQALSNLEVKMMVKCFEISWTNRSIKAEKIKKYHTPSRFFVCSSKNCGSSLVCVYASILFTSWNIPIHDLKFLIKKVLSRELVCIGLCSLVIRIKGSYQTLWVNYKHKALACLMSLCLWITSMNFWRLGLPFVIS